MYMFILYLESFIYMFDIHVGGLVFMRQSFFVDKNVVCCVHGDALAKKAPCHQNVPF